MFGTSEDAPGIRKTRKVARAIVSVALLATSVAAQTPSYSSSPEYKSMLRQIHDDLIQPSRMGTGSFTPQPPSLNARESRSAFHLACARWKLDVTKKPWSMALTSGATGQAWQLDANSIAWNHVVLSSIDSIHRIAANHWQMQAAVTGARTPASIDLEVLSSTVVRVSIRAPKLDGAVSPLRLRLNGSGPFFGLGERFDRVKLDGLRTMLRPEDLFGKPGHNWTYIPVPFLFTPRGLGLYLDTARITDFDLSGATQQHISIQSDDPSIDAYFFIGTPKEILTSYTALTGRTPVLPPWAYGVWICSYQGPEQVFREARRLRDEKIPASAIWTFDVMDQGDIMGWPLWWTGYYPDPRKFTDALHAMGFKSLTYIHPYLRSVLDPYNLPSPAYEAGKRDDLFILDKEGRPTGPAFEPFRDGNIDFTRPENVDWWEKRIRQIVVDQNFDGWMEDFGEWVNDTDRFAAGASGRTMANLNPLIYHRITYEIAHNAKPDIVPFDRSGYAGSQGYTPVVWGGDQRPDWSEDYGLPSVVRAGITAGLSGFSVWGPDIAENGNSVELWTRWVEFGALTPIMRDHQWDRPRGAIDLWSSAETLNTWREYARLHISLFPYFDAYAHQAADTGLPIMRHLLLDYPDDANTYNLADEYLLGESILVAPVIKQGATSRSVYLPQGSWSDYWTGDVLEGGRTVTVAAPLRQIPLFVRAGSLLPLIDPDTETLAADLAPGKYRTLNGNLTWRIFPAKAAAHSSIKLGDGTIAESTEDTSLIEIKVQHAPGSRMNHVIVPAASAPKDVVLGNHTLTQTEASTEPGWRLDAATQTLHILFQSSDFDLRIHP